MATEKLHPALVVLTSYVAALTEVDGDVLAELMERSTRSPKRTVSERHHMRILAQLARNTQAAKREIHTEEAQRVADELAEAVAQALDEQMDHEA